MERMKRFLLLLICCLLATTPVQAKTLIKVAAVVNNNIISSYQLDQAVHKALDNLNKEDQLTEEQFAQLQKQVLEQLISEELVAQRIKELNLQVTEAELETAIGDVQKKNNLNRDQLVEALQAQGMTLEGFRDKLKKEILRFKLLGHEVNYKVQVTQSEIREYFREHIDQYRAAPKVRLSHISYPIPTDADEETLRELRKQADDCRDQLLRGKSFDQVLASQGAAATGSDMGNLVEQDLAEQLRNALTGLEVGQVTEPMVMNGQLHLFLVTERNPGDIHLFDRVSPEIEEILVQEKTEARFKEWSKELREQGQIDIRI